MSNAYQPLQSPSSAARQVRLRSTLHRVADALGTTPDALIEAAKDEASGDETAELLRFWVKITSKEDRCLVIEQVRKIVTLAT